MIKCEACPWVDSEGGQRVGIPPTGESHMAIGFLKILAWSTQKFGLLACRERFWLDSDYMQIKCKNNDIFC